MEGLVLAFLLGVALGYFLGKAFKYMVATVLVFVVGTYLSVWSLPELAGINTVAGCVPSVSGAGLLAVLAVGPVGAGIIIGSVLALLR